MSLSDLFFIGSCIAMYKFGAYNERYPGEASRRLREMTRWVWKWMNQ